MRFVWDVHLKLIFITHFHIQSAVNNLWNKCVANVIVQIQNDSTVVYIQHGVLILAPCIHLWHLCQLSFNWVHLCSMNCCMPHWTTNYSVNQIEQPPIVLNEFRGQIQSQKRIKAHLLVLLQEPLLVLEKTHFQHPEAVTTDVSDQCSISCSFKHN